MGIKTSVNFAYLLFNGFALVVKLIIDLGVALGASCGNIDLYEERASA
jgi:hypothetical protein